MLTGDVSKFQVPLSMPVHAICQAFVFVFMPATLKGVKLHLLLVLIYFLTLFLFIHFYFSPEDMFINFRGRGREGERKKHRCEKHQSVAFHMHPNWGLNPQLKYVP